MICPFCRLEQVTHGIPCDVCNTTTAIKKRKVLVDVGIISTDGRLDDTEVELEDYALNGPMWNVTLSDDTVRLNSTDWPNGYYHTDRYGVWRKNRDVADDYSEESFP